MTHDNTIPVQTVRRRIILIAFALLAIIAAILATSRGRNLLWSLFTRIRGRHTVAERLQQYGDQARQRLQPHFKAAGIKYPPPAVALLAIKDERKLQVYAGPNHESLQFITEYAIQGQSGTLGPKLREGDRQVPEGRYPIESLNPNSRFHLALRVGYPNQFDRDMGKQDGRTNLGSDIMIHGGSASIGCLAMGDPAAEDLFVLVADSGRSNTVVIITPFDFRKSGKQDAPSRLPRWVPDLYSQLRIELKRLPPHNELQ